MPRDEGYTEETRGSSSPQEAGRTPENQPLSESDISQLGQRLFEGSFAVWYQQHRPANLTEALEIARKVQGPLSAVRLPAKENMNIDPNNGLALVEEEYLGFGVNGLDRSQLDSVAVARETTLNKLFTDVAENDGVSPSRANQRGVFAEIPLGDVAYRVHAVSQSSTNFQEGWVVSGGFATVPLQATEGHSGVSMLEEKLSSLS